MVRRCIRFARIRLAKVSGLATMRVASWARRSSRNAISATAIWMRTAFSEVPRKWLIFRVCLTHAEEQFDGPAPLVEVGDLLAPARRDRW